MHPVLVALLTGLDNKIAGVQRTYLKPDGTGKAPVPTPKLSLGRIRGAAIRLDLGRAVWAATGEGNMANMALPDLVRSVTIGADNDESGERHAQRAAWAFSEQGREARIMRPFTGFADFNAELQGVAA